MTPYLKPKKVLTSSTPKVISFFLQHLDPNLLFATTKQLYVSLNYPHVTYPPFVQMKTTREWEPNYLPQTWTNNHYWLSIGLTLLFMWLKKIELFSPLPWRPLELEDQGVCQFSTHKHCSSAFWAWIKASKPHIQLWVAHFVECGKVSQIANSCIKLPHPRHHPFVVK